MHLTRYKELKRTLTPQIRQAPDYTPRSNDFIRVLRKYHRSIYQRPFVQFHILTKYGNAIKTIPATTSMYTFGIK